MDVDKNKSDIPISEMIKGERQRPLREPLLAVIGGLLIIISSLWQYIQTMTTIALLPPSQIDQFQLEIFMLNFNFGLIATVMIFIGTLVMFMKHSRIGGYITFPAGVLGFLSPGNGFFFGPILAILAGLLASVETKPPEVGSMDEVL